jgi:hypothetical protein
VVPQDLYWLAMLHVHRNVKCAVGQVNPEAGLKRWDSSGNRKIHLAFAAYVLSMDLILGRIKAKTMQLAFVASPLNTQL